MALHSSTLAWKIPWTEEPGRLQSMGSLRVRHDWATSLSLFTFMHWRRKWQPTPVFLPGESHGQRSLVSYNPWGRKQLDTTGYTRLWLCWKRGILQYFSYLYRSSMYLSELFYNFSKRFFVNFICSCFIVLLLLWKIFLWVISSNCVLLNKEMLQSLVHWSCIGLLLLLLLSRFSRVQLCVTL